MPLNCISTNWGGGGQLYKFVIGYGVSLISEMCISVTPPAQLINYGRSLTSTLSKYDTYYSVTYLYFSSINNICAILAVENDD